MVSFWPWKGDGSSPASFEKTLSALSKKITTTQTQLEKARSTSRRMRVLWTLYLTFAYLVYAIVMLLVVGLKNLGALEWTGMASGPVLIYVVRTASSMFFNFRIDTLTARLKDQQTERAKTIQKLKDATKYDSTLELLEKYGGSENKAPKKGRDVAEGETPGGQGPGAGTPNRTRMQLPATANIPRGDTRPAASAPGTPQPRPGAASGAPHHAGQPALGLEASAEFAPNAFGPGAPPPSAYYEPALTGAGTEPHWYDRILDLLLGEDETAAKNRIALICARCRLVNGQAPPGAKTLADIGVWKCMACGAANGEADEGRRIVREVLGEKVAAVAVPADGPGTEGDSSSDLVEVKEEDVDESAGESSSGDRESEKTRSKLRQRRPGQKKKGGG